MAEFILTNVLNKKIEIEELLKWLTTDNPEKTISPEIEENGCTRTDFISYFLNYLREQCKSVLPRFKETQGKPTKKIPGQIVVADKKALGCEEATVIPSFINNKDYANDWRTRNAQQVNYQPRPVVQALPVSPLLHGVSVASFGPRLPAAANLRSPCSPGNFPPWPYEAMPGSPMFDPAWYQCVSADAQTRNVNFLQGQPSGNWNHGDIPKYQTQLMSPRQYFDNSMDGNYPTASSPYNPNVVACNEIQARMMNLHDSLARENIDPSFYNVSSNPSSPARYNASMRTNSSTVNSSLAACSPVSPLYADNASILHAPSSRSEKSYNQTHYSYDHSGNSVNTSRTSTPKSTSTGSAQKSAKSGQNQSFCLGDFINSDSIRSNRSARKHLKINSSKTSQAGKKTPGEMVLEKENVSGRSETKANETRAARRIKPTRLNVAGDKESRETEVFGVISRPTAANPKFVEAPSTDKCQEELLFEVERGLLKLERQRQPKTEMVIKTESKMPSKGKLDSATVPSLDLVENIETLDTLAALYCGILQRNLMPNPMSELYFVMTLLTTQYKTADEKKIVPNDAAASKQSPPSSAQSLDTFRDDLGCSELPDDSSVDNNGETSNCEEQSAEKSLIEDKNEISRADSSSADLEDPATDHKKQSLEYLKTPHNCVYFATVVMFKQRYLLGILDRATLKLLCENQQIASFQPELQKYLNDIYSVKCSQMKRAKQTGNSQTNVCFQVDTDNRETFPSSASFALFRKQRDLFYEILKDWEDNHLKPDWSYQRALKNKINTLLTLHTDAVNYCHLAKLFISQLLVSSVQKEKVEDPMNDESLSFLKSLKHLNPEKLLQLKGRLVTPLNSTGPVPQPKFPGVQEFYQEFILNASNWKFYVILEDTLVSEIMELNEAQFAHSDIESTETMVDESTKQDFITSVSSLRLLAKFTSFTLSLPFRTAANSPEWLLSQIQLRGRVLPSLDLQSCLLDAWTNGRLSLTVPWIVQYMAMLDPVTLRLPYFVNIGELLYCIYRHSNRPNSEDNNDHPVSPRVSALMAFTIGWLFELTQFPRDLYAHWQTNYEPKKIQILDRPNNLRAKYRNMISMNEETGKDFVKCSTTLDQMDIIDDRAFYECCPFLIEFKILLVSGNAMLSNNNANRHITPVSSQLSQPSFGVKTKNLQMQLEEAFFHGQQSSVRKTVEFVAERVASSCVKHICITIVPSLKQRCIKDYIKSKNGQIDLIQKDDDAEERTDGSPAVSPSKSHRKAQAEVAKLEMDELATTIMENVKRESLQKMSAICEMRTTKSMEAFLSDDVLPVVRETCIAIANRTAIERVKQWIDSHVLESLCLKNMNNEIKRLLKEVNNDQPIKESRHNVDVPSSAEVIEMIRNAMWELLEKKNRWSELSIDYISNTLDYLQRTLTERADLVGYTERNLFMISVEYCLLLITHKRDLFTVELQDKFLNIWKMHNSRTKQDEGLFVRLISPRNIRLLTSTADSSVMKVFARLLKSLLRENLLNIESLSDQCVALFRQDWPEPILKQLSQCLKEGLADYKCPGAHAEGMKYLLDWIATTCDEMEIYE